MLKGNYRVKSLKISEIYINCKIINKLVELATATIFPSKAFQSMVKDARYDAMWSEEQILLHIRPDALCSRTKIIC